MRITASRQSLRCTLVGLALLGAGCKAKPPAEPPYVPAEGAVGFDVKLESGPSTLQEPTRWPATYKSGGSVAQFRFELGKAQESSTTPIRVAFGKGKFVAVPGSEPASLMIELKKALEAKALPTNVARVESVSFEYATIGTELSRQTDGGLSGDRKGDWTAIKLFLGNDQGEVFLNVNPVLGKGEFSIKDPDYGDFVVGELAKVL